MGLGAQHLSQRGRRIVLSDPRGYRVGEDARQALTEPVGRLYCPSGLDSVENRQDARCLDRRDWQVADFGRQIFDEASPALIACLATHVFFVSANHRSLTRRNVFAFASDRSPCAAFFSIAGSLPAASGAFASSRRLRASTSVTARYDPKLRVLYAGLVGALALQPSL